MWKRRDVEDESRDSQILLIPVPVPVPVPKISFNKENDDLKFVQDVFTEVGCRNCFGEKNRHTFSILNQLFTGHTLLNQHRAKVNKNVSNLCDTCKVLEDASHFLFTCKAYVDQRNSLEATVDDIVHRGLDSIGDINFKVLNGAIENISRQGQNDALGALLLYIKCANRFEQN